VVVVSLLALAAAAYVLFVGRQAPQAVPAAGPARTPPAANYVGSSACSGCHRQEYDAWRGSHHDLAMAQAGPETVLGDFNGATFEYAGVKSRFFRRDGRYFVRTDGPDGRLAEFEIEYTFGVTPLQQYLIPMPGGRLQALGIAWDTRPKEQGGQRWFHLYPGQQIEAGDPLHWTGVNQNWNFMCAECHSTNLRKNFDAQTGRYDTTWSEIDVACEACHGPGSRHVDWANRKGVEPALAAADKGLVLALDERRGVSWQTLPGSGRIERSAPRASSREIDMCARCHARAARISDDYVHGGAPLDTHRLALLDDDLYWNDGQMRDEVYNWGSFVQSRMYAAGVTCSDCHDPHTLKLRAPGNAVCAQCHHPASYDNPKHTHHPAGTPGASCAACHMPSTTYMVIDTRHDHSMRVPRPDVSARLDTPNACNDCHADKPAQWAADALQAWTGRPPAGFQNFGEALRAGSLGTPGAREALVFLIRDKAQPGIVRASALSRLGLLLDASALDAVAWSLNDPDAQVRLAAVEALANADPPTRLRFLPRMLVDPVRAVRIEAATALAGQAEAGIPAGERAAFAKALDEYVAVQRYHADRPEGRMSLGNLYAARNEPERAIAEYRKALEIDPTFVAAYANLADLYRSLGREKEAETVLHQGLAKLPRAAALHHALGLALARQKRGEEALRELGEAARLDPASPRYTYVWGVALNDAGRRKEALAALGAALDRHPNDRELLLALAQLAAQAGDRAGAADYARRLIALDPENAGYASLAAQLGVTP
jgi:tetratricopeptide (TPR) repeat protein